MNIAKRAFRFIFLTLLFIASSDAVGREVQSIKIVNDGRTFNVPAFVHNNVLYMSLNEFARHSSLRMYSDDKTKKIELRVHNSRMKFAADNPFVIVLTHSTNSISEVYQMPVEVMKSDAAYYVPISTLLPLLSKVWQRSLLLNEALPELRISTSTKPVAKVTGKLPVSTGKKDAGAASTTSVKTSATAAKTSKVKEAGSVGQKGSGSAADKAATAAATASSKSPVAAKKAPAFTITHLTVDTRKNGTLIRVHSNASLKGYNISKTAEGNLAISIPNVTVDVAELRQTPTDGEEITSVKAEQLGKNARIEIGLGSSFTETRVSKDVKTNDLLVTMFRKAEVAKIYKDEKKEAARKPDTDRKNWKIDCIVIDPGHGGRDPGAIGVSGIKEKNIVLGIALKLGKLIERKMPGAKVVYTRKDDRSVALDKRGQIANQAGGDLFLSIHCNSLKKKPSSVRGFEVYILRPGRTDDAVRVAEFENSVIKLEKNYKKRYAKLTNENFILVNMAQSAYVKYSERVAELLHEQVTDSKQIDSKGVKQAGFYVLVGASMPSVLIESGFISNAKEEQFLSSRFGQQHMANLYFTAIEKYAREYEKSLNK